MVKRIVWSANALADRIQILDYWYCRTGTKRYSRILDLQLKEAIKNLMLNPNIGRLVEGREERFLVKSFYQIYYKLTKTEVYIIHIWDCRRNPDDLILNHF